VILLIYEYHKNVGCWKHDSYKSKALPQKNNYKHNLKLNNLTYDIEAPGAKKAILRFVIKLVIVFTAWHFTYIFLLGPARLIDKPLNDLLATSVVKCLNTISPSTAPVTWAELPNKQGSQLIQNNKFVFGIADICNGVNLMFTYVSVILLLPYPAKRKIIFSLGGIMAIIITNIIRICALYFISVYKKAAFDFSHHYLFTILMDLLIFYGWLLFIKKKETV
jgi:exosortase/archaeosortase family protein